MGLTIICIAAIGRFVPENACVPEHEFFLPDYPVFRPATGIWLFEKKSCHDHIVHLQNVW
jgi:hypothetical protein